MDQTLDIRVLLSNLGNGPWDSNVCLLKLSLSLEEGSGTNTVDYNILISDDMSYIGFASEILELDVGLVTHISSWLEFLEIELPDACSSSVRVDTGRSNSSKHASSRHTKNTRTSENSGINA